MLLVKRSACVQLTKAKTRLALQSRQHAYTFLAWVDIAVLHNKAVNDNGSCKATHLCAGSRLILDRFASLASGLGTRPHVMKYRGFIKPWSEFPKGSAKRVGSQNAGHSEAIATITWQTSLYAAPVHKIWQGARAMPRTSLHLQNSKPQTLYTDTFLQLASVKLFRTVSSLNTN